MSTEIDKRGRGLQQKYTFCTCFLCPVQQATKKIFFFCIVNVLNSKHTDQHCKKKSFKQSLSFEGPSPLSVYLGRHWCHACDKCSQVFCLHFCVLQTIKNWTVGSPKNEVTRSSSWEIPMAAQNNALLLFLKPYLYISSPVFLEPRLIIAIRNGLPLLFHWNQAR